MTSGDQLKLKYPNAATEGCAVCCAAQVTNPEIRVAQVDELIEYLVTTSALRKDMYVLDWDALLSVTAYWMRQSHFGQAPVRTWQSEGYHPEPPAGGTYIIRNRKPGYAHFTAMIQGELFDPLPPDRPAAKSYIQHEYLALKIL